MINARCTFWILTGLLAANVSETRSLAQVAALRAVLPSKQNTGLPLLSNPLKSPEDNAFLTRLSAFPDLANPDTCFEGRSKIYYFTSPYRIGKAGVRSLPHVGVLEAVRLIDAANMRMFESRLSALEEMEVAIADSVDWSRDSIPMDPTRLVEAKSALLNLARAREAAHLERWRLSLARALVHAGIAVDAQPSEQMLLDAVVELKSRSAGVVTLSLVRGFTEQEMSALGEYAVAVKSEIPCLEVRPLSGLGDVSVSFRGTTSAASLRLGLDAPGTVLHGASYIAGDGTVSFEVTAAGWKSLESKARTGSLWAPSVEFRQKLILPVPVNAKVACVMDERVKMRRELRVEKYPGVYPRDVANRSDDLALGREFCNVENSTESTGFYRFLVQNATEKFLAKVARERELTADHKEAVLSQLASDTDFFRNLALPVESVLTKETKAVQSCWEEVQRTCKMYLVRCLSGWNETRTSTCESVHKEISRWLDKPVPMLVDVGASFDSNVSLTETFEYEGVEPVEYPLSIGNSISVSLALDSAGLISSASVSDSN